MRVMKLEDLKVGEAYWMVTVGQVREVVYLGEEPNDYSREMGINRLSFDVGERYLSDYTRANHNGIYTEEAEAREWVADEGYQESLAEHFRQCDEWDREMDHYDTGYDDMYEWDYED